MVKTSTAEQHGYRCPECDDDLSRDTTSKGYVRHLKNRECRFEAGERDAGGATSSESAVETGDAAMPAAALSPAASDRIRSVIEQSVNSLPVMPPTEIFNEGWLLRLALDWFARHPDVAHPMAVPPGTNWYSEALLASQFASRFRGDRLSESHTHADGVVGHFHIGHTGQGDLFLEPDARYFVVLEAKVGSRLSVGTTHAPDFDQAARNVACMAHALSKADASIEDFDRLGFFVVAPGSQIRLGLFDSELTNGSLRSKVLKRVEAYEDARKSVWYEKWFLPTLNRVDIGTVSWEEVIALMSAVDKQTATWFADFYETCLYFNKVTAA